MRWLAFICILCLAATAAEAADIKTGHDLLAACRDYVSKDTGQDSNARTPHACRSFLQGFAVALKAREDARLDAMVRGLPYSSKEACVRMPDFISFKDLANRIVVFGQRHAELLNGAAMELAQKTLENDFPCPPPPQR
jgi:hypothetical protein